MKNFSGLTYEQQQYITLLRQESTMNFNLLITPLVSLIAGILILVVPRLLNFIVAIYLIIIGLIGLLGSGHLLR
ncbi:hypothetical protein GCM10011396_32460 [Undibacterium terreum]|uniref:DUF3096 domain-containing protein n=2 Tax=Undibacterium terreum TaxID=1224302 RepID=A0A916XKX6_9BURK|nr:hypothetical protein GCM10011396_32460 [Undibacterium terreum]